MLEEARLHGQEPRDLAESPQASFDALEGCSNLNPSQLPAWRPTGSPFPGAGFLRRGRLGLGWAALFHLLILVEAPGVLHQLVLAVILREVLVALVPAASGCVRGELHLVELFQDVAGKGVLLFARRGAPGSPPSSGGGRCGRLRAGPSAAGRTSARTPLPPPHSRSGLGVRRSTPFLLGCLSLATSLAAFLHGACRPGAVVPRASGHATARLATLDVPWAPHLAQKTIGWRPPLPADSTNDAAYNRWERCALRAAGSSPGHEEAAAAP